jgi:hypothetical protein
MRVKSTPVKSLSSSLSSEIEPSYQPQPPELVETVPSLKKTYAGTVSGFTKRNHARDKENDASVHVVESSSKGFRVFNGRPKHARYIEPSPALPLSPDVHRPFLRQWNLNRGYEPDECNMSDGELELDGRSKSDWQKTVLAACVLTASHMSQQPQIGSGGAFSSVGDRESVESVSSVGIKHPHAPLGVQFINKAILVLGSESTKVPTQKQIQRQGMTTTKQQKARAFLKQAGTIIVNTRTELSPRFPTLGHVREYLRTLLDL